ncbi:MAG: hypothetical protein CMB37_06835 [Euryarchaeota archaeon]|nr:hypothetical protein [Euryarchaeota archaeon]
MCVIAPRFMRTSLALVLVGLLVVAVPATASFELVEQSGLEDIDSGPLTNWAAYGPGVAWGDYDSDGDMDVFITARFDHHGQETAEKLGYEKIADIPLNHTDYSTIISTSKGQSHLLQNQGDGTFIDVSVETGLGSDNVTTIGATWVDFDGDGDVDIYLSNYGRGDVDSPEGTGENNQMYVNENGTFRDVTLESGLGNKGHSSGSVWADYDHDGDMDCYSLNFGMIDEYLALARSESNILYRNDGDQNGDGIPEFSDQTSETKLFGQEIDSEISDFDTYISPAYSMIDTAPGNPSSQMSLPPAYREVPEGSGYSWAAVWFDANGDGWEDLYVASDFGVSPIYINDGDGSFTLSTETLGMMKTGTGMGAHAADFDSDGDFDLCQSNFGPNFLWVNNLNYFSEDAESLSIHTNTLVNWDCHFLDFDLDGDMDLWFGVGRINQYVSLQYNSLYRNDGDLDGDGHIDFTDVAEEIGLSGTNKTMGVAMADYDGDGDLDLLLAHSDGPPQLWKNTAVEDASGQWIKIRLHGTDGGSNSHGIGCTVTVYLENGDVLKQTSYAGDGYLGSSEPAIHFGLGPHSVERIEVQWSTGYIQTIENISVNSQIEISEELPPPIVDYSQFILGIICTALILLQFDSHRRNS